MVSCHTLWGAVVRKGGNEMDTYQVGVVVVSNQVANQVAAVGGDDAHLFCERKGQHLLRDCFHERWGIHDLLSIYALRADMVMIAC